MKFTDLFKGLNKKAENELVYKEFYDIMGRKSNQDGTLTPGIYIIVEYYSNGDIITRKIYLHGNE